MFTTSEPPKYSNSNSPNLCFDFFYWICNKQFEVNIRLRFRKGCVIPEQLALLLIKQKNHNKRFGEFEFEYFGDSDVVNKIFNCKFHNPIRVSGYTLLPMFRVFTPNQQFKMSSSVVESIKWRLLSTWFLSLIILSLKFSWFYSTYFVHYGINLEGTADKTGRAIQLVNLCSLLSNTQVYKVRKLLKIEIKSHIKIFFSW